MEGGRPMVKVGGTTLGHTTVSAVISEALPQQFLLLQLHLPPAVLREALLELFLC